MEYPARLRPPLKDDKWRNDADLRQSARLRYLALVHELLELPDDHWRFGNAAWKAAPV